MDTRIQYFALCSLIAGVFVVSCGDSGGGGVDAASITQFNPAGGGDVPVVPGGDPEDGPPPDDAGPGAPDKPGVSLAWSLPGTRLDGRVLHGDEISGYVIVFVSDEEIRTVSGSIGDRIGTIKAFREKQEDIGQFISGADLSDLIVSGSPNVVLVPAPQTSYRLEGLDRDTYHFAVSAYDWAGLYSPLSGSVKKVLKLDGGKVVGGR